MEEERLGLLMQVCVDLGAQTEYILPLVRPRVAGAVPTATDARIAAIERQLAIAIGRLDVYEGRLHQMHRVVNWPRRASRKVRKKSAAGYFRTPDRGRRADSTASRYGVNRSSRLPEGMGVDES